MLTHLVCHHTLTYQSSFSSPFRKHFEGVRPTYVAEWDLLLSECPTLRLGEKFTVEEFIWARAIVQSRVFRKTGGGGRFAAASRTSSVDSQRKDMCGNVEHVLALVPIADLLNHAQKPNVGWGFDESKDAFVLEAKRGMIAGDAGFDSYGSFRTNS